MIHRRLQLEGEHLGGAELEQHSGPRIRGWGLLERAA
jgi:hypothetical protein